MNYFFWLTIELKQFNIYSSTLYIGTIIDIFMILILWCQYLTTKLYTNSSSFRKNYQLK